MIQSSLSNFASQLKSVTVGKEESSQDHETSPESIKSPLRIVWILQRGKKEASDEEDPDLNQVDPNLDQLMLMEE